MGSRRFDFVQRTKSKGAKRRAKWIFHNFVSWNGCKSAVSEISRWLQNPVRDDISNGLMQILV